MLSNHRHHSTKRQHLSSQQLSAPSYIGKQDQRFFNVYGQQAPSLNQKSVKNLKLCNTQYCHELLFQGRSQVSDVKDHFDEFFDLVEKDQISLYGITIKGKQADKNEPSQKSQNKGVFSLIKSFLPKQEQNSEEAQITNIKSETQPQLQTHSRTKDLSNWQKLYLLSCFKLFNKEAVSLKEVNQVVQETIDQSSIFDVDQIRIVGSQTKFDKADRTLSFRRKQNGDQSWTIEPRIQRLDSLIGNVITRSKKKILVQNGPTFQFSEEILQMATYQQYIAVRTSANLYICICATGKMLTYNVKIQHMRWGYRGLYALGQGGYILLLEHQRNHHTLFNKTLPFPKQFSKGGCGKWSEKDFLIPCEKEMIHGTMCQQGHIYLRIIGGPSTKAKLNIDEDYYKVLYMNGYSRNKTVIVVALVGRKDVIEEMYEYRFVYA